MYWRILTNIIFIIFLSIIQISFVSALPGWLNNINLIIIFLVFVLSLKGFVYGIWWAIGTGMVLEVYSFLPVGVYLFSLVFAILIANFLLVNFFTNRSLYSYLALSFSAIFSYEFILYILNYFLSYFLNYDFVLNLNKNFFADKLSLLIVNGLMTVIVFNIFNFISKNFQPVFLIKGSAKK